MWRHLVQVLAVVLVAGACHGRQPGYDSPTAVAEAYVAAIRAGDADQAGNLFPSPDVIRAAQHCEAGKVDGLADGVEEARAHLLADLAASRLLEPEFVSSRESERELPLSMEACRTGPDVLIVGMAESVSVLRGGQRNVEMRKITVVRLAGRWYLASA